MVRHALLAARAVGVRDRVAIAARHPPTAAPAVQVVAPAVPAAQVAHRVARAAVRRAAVIVALLAAAIAVVERQLLRTIENGPAKGRFLWRTASAIYLRPGSCVASARAVV